MLRSQSWDLSIFANVFYFNRLSGNCRERNSTSDDLSSSFSKSAVYFYWFHVEFVYFWNLINDGLPNVLYWLTIVSSFKPRVLNRITYRFPFAFGDNTKDSSTTYNLLPDLPEEESFCEH